MKTKTFDAIKMVRSIRDKSSTEYYSNKKRWFKKLSELQGHEIKLSPSGVQRKAGVNRKLNPAKSGIA